MNHLLIKAFNTSCSLSSVAFLGVYKVVIFLAIEHIYGLEVLGETASLQSIAQIIAFFIAVNWGTLILVRCGEKGENVDELLTTAFLTTCLILSFFFVYNLFLDLNWLKTLLWVVGWSWYALVRYIYIAKNSKILLFFKDLFLLLTSLLILVMLEKSIALSFLPILLILLSIFSVVYWKSNLVIKLPCFETLSKGGKLGLVNLMGGGVALSLLPIAEILEGKLFAGEFAIFLSISSVVLLLPRAVSYNFIPSLLHKGAINKSIYKKMKKHFVLMSFAGLVLTIITLITSHLYFRAYLANVFTIQVASLSLVVLGTLYSTVLIVKEEMSYLFKLNLFTFLMYILSCLLCVYTKINAGFLILNIVILISNVFRVYFIRLEAKKHVS